MDTDPLFNSVMTDLTGRARLESEDPRWGQLFRNGQLLLSIKGDETPWVSFCSRLMENNPQTGNLSQLMEQTTGQLRTLLSRKTRPSKQSLEACCVSLHLTSLIVNLFASRISPAEIRRQLFMSPDWPSSMNPLSSSSSTPKKPPHPQQQQQQQQHYYPGDLVVEALLNELIAVIQAHHLLPWIYDIMFYSANLLISLMSTQLYQLDNSSIAVLGDDLFIHFFYVCVESQLKSALSRGDGDITDSGPAKFVKGLILLIMDSHVPPPDSIVPLSQLPADSQVWSGVVGGSRSSNANREGGLGSDSSLSLQTLAVASSTYNKEARQKTTTLQVRHPGRDTITEAVREVLLGSIGAIWQWPVLAIQSILRITTGVDLGLKSQNQRMQQRKKMSGGQNSQNNDQHSNGGMDDNDGSITEAAKEKHLYPLAEKALTLLLILLHNRRPVTNQGSGSMANPLRQIFCLLNDEGLDCSRLKQGLRNVEGGAGGGVGGEGGGRQGDWRSDAEEEDLEMMMIGQQNAPQDRRIHFNFKDLVTCLTSNLPSDSYTLLLYSFLQIHPTFVDSLIVTGSVEPIMTAVLKGLYGASDSKLVDHLYVLVVCVLMMVQDSTLRPILANLKTTPTFYTERQLVDIPLLDLIILCILRTIMHALFRLKGDQYLLSNCFAVLLNITPYVGDMHSYTAERLVKILRRLVRRIINDNESANNSNKSSINSSSSSSSSSSSIQSSSCTLVDPDLPNDSSSFAIGVNANTTNSTSPSSSSSTTLTTSLHNTLAVLLKLIGTALRPIRRACNVQLTYALIHEYEFVKDSLFHPLVCHIASANLISPDSSSNEETSNNSSNSANGSSSSSSGISVKASNTFGDTDSPVHAYNTSCLSPPAISSMVKHYLAALEGKNDKSFKSATQAVITLRKEIEDEQRALEMLRQDEQSSTPPLSSDDAMTTMTSYLYEEGECPEAFFVPFAWSSMLRKSGEMNWYISRVAIIDTVAAGLIINPNQSPPSSPLGDNFV